MFNTMKFNKQFLLVFVISYGILYTINYISTGLLQPEGYYSAWLHQNLDYVRSYRTFLLTGTALVTELFGHNTFLRGDILFVKDGHNIRMAYSCMGINILCLWWAFTIAVPMSVKKKLFHFMLGTACLIILNITRLSLLTMSPKDVSLGQMIIDHHDLYNCIVYGLILIAMKHIVDKRVIVSCR